MKTKIDRLQLILQILVTQGQQPLLVNWSNKVIEIVEQKINCQINLRLKFDRVDIDKPTTNNEINTKDPASSKMVSCG